MPFELKTIAIALVGFLESFAVAQSLAARRRESVEGNQELVALGVANLGASLSGGSPVILLDGAEAPLSALVEIRE